MRMGEGCDACMYRKQAAKVKDVKDIVKREAFIKEIREALDNREKDDPSPYMVYQFDRIYEKYFGAPNTFKEERKSYNALVMSMESEIQDRINASEDPLATALIYARIGNYIDFGALSHVDTEEFLELLEKKADEGLDPAVYKQFLADCEKGERFLHLCDNCGEIVLDKLFIRQLKKRFPHLKVDVMVRGAEVLNDATMEDAVFCGMAQEANVISNGGAVPGTVEKMLSSQAMETYRKADVILAKGQGNYESLAGCKKNVYYLFLCKCDLFITMFQVPKFTGMFVHESAINI